MQLVVNSLLTNYERSGKGKPTVLLLHGWGDDLRTFAKLQQDLADYYEVISVDLPGFGASQPPDEVWLLDNYAQFLCDFLKKLDVQHVHAIVAHSNGGAVAIKGLALHVLHADKLVLLAAAGIRTKQKGRRLILKVIAKTGKVVTFWLPVQHKKKLQKALYGVAGSDMLVVPHMQETFKKTVAQDVQQDATKLQLPVLLVYGEQDRATPPLYGELFHNLIPNSSLELIKAGHFVHHDQPQQTAKTIKEFLS